MAAAGRLLEAQLEEEDEQLVAPPEPGVPLLPLTATRDAWAARAAAAAAAPGAMPTRRQPSRHASFDAADVLHKAIAAATSITAGSGGAVPAAAAAAAGSNVIASSSTGGGGGASIEIGWVWPPCLASDDGTVE